MIAILNWHDPRPHSAGFHLDGFPPVPWWLTQTKVLLMYLKLTIWPWPLATHYGMPLFYSIGDAWPFVLISTAIVIAVVILLSKRNAIGFVGAWVLGLLAPTAIVPLLNEIAQERRMYLPLAAIAMLFVIGGYSLLRRAAKNRWPIATMSAMSVMLMVVYGVVSAHRLSIYPNPIALWQSTIDLWPEDALAHNNLGVSLREAGRLNEALEHYQIAERIRPKDPDVHNNLGNVLVDLGRGDEAMIQYEQALQAKPAFAEAHNNLGFQLARRGQTEAALQQYKLAIQARGDYPQAYNNLAILMADIGNLPAAIEAYQRALVLKPDYADAHNGLGVALADSNHLPEAIAQYHEALRLKPDFADAYDNLGNALVNAGRIPEAIEQFHQALRLKPDDSAAHNNLGIALATSGQNDQAIENFQQATRLDPTFTRAFFNLAVASSNAGHVQQAIAAAQKAIQLARSQNDLALAQQMQGWLQNYRAAHPGGS
jgi:superkiller protein 3